MRLRKGFLVRTALLGALLAGTVLAAVPAAAPAAAFGCDASAFRGTVLGAPSIEPITANRGSAVCQNAQANLSTAGLTLPAPLSADAAAAQTVITDTHNAGSAGGVANLAVNLSKLPLALPVPSVPVPSSLGSIPVSVDPTSLLGKALAQQCLVSLVTCSTSGTVTNALPQVQALVNGLINTKLPNVDLLRLQAAQSYATAACQGATPKLAGSSTVTGLSLLGQNITLPTTTVTNALQLLNGQTINLSGINAGGLSLSSLGLPAGWSTALSFGDVTVPLVGTINVGQALQATIVNAIQQALNGLSVSVPGTVGSVTITPAQQTNTGDTLSQDALRVQISALGQTLVDLVIGEARIAQKAVDCALPATKPGTAPTPAAVALQCTTRKLTLIDVLERGDHVDLVGGADRSLVGKRVSIFFTGTSSKVATAVVKPDGSFRTTAPLPPESLRHTNLARYQARMGKDRSLNLKLERRLIVDSMSASGGSVTIRGRVIQPLTRPPSAILIQRRVSCTKDVTVARVRPRRNGHWVAVVKAPPGQQAAVYRAATKVLHTLTTPVVDPTFTLPRVVDLRH
ncbi:MAG: hypothetical protein E6G56_01755 [Actinobacteria bacterium]|nr:MAG: hypothetical protein E6G56_01755 [Actinomycetota bacterium]